MVNHFRKTEPLTTKSGLTQTLRNLKWFANADPNSFYPRCFDCTQESEVEDFMVNFKATKAQSVLKKFVRM